MFRSADYRLTGMGGGMMHRGGSWDWLPPAATPCIGRCGCTRRSLVRNEAKNFCRSPAVTTKRGGSCPLPDGVVHSILSSLCPLHSENVRPQRHTQVSCSRASLTAESAATGSQNGPFIPHDRGLDRLGDPGSLVPIHWRQGRLARSGAVADTASGTCSAATNRPTTRRVTDRRSMRRRAWALHAARCAMHG